MRQPFDRSWPTGLTTGKRLTPGGTDGPTFVVVSPGVSGRTSWRGNRVCDCDAGSAGWEETTGQEGPESGKVRLRRSDGTETNATFKIRWEAQLSNQANRCLLSRNPKKYGKKNTFIWRMVVKRTLKVDGVTYVEAIRQFAQERHVCSKCVR